MHDNPSIYPQLPSKPMDEQILALTPEDSEYRAAWEFVLSHELTEREGSAFWHGADIQAAATRRSIEGTQ